MGSEFIKPTTNLPKGDTYKIVPDGRLLNTITDVSKYHLPLLPVSIPRIIDTIFSTTDLSTAYHQVALTLKNQKLVHFVVGKEQYKHKQGFYGLKSLPGFHTRLVTILFPPLITKGEIITYFDDIVIQADNKTQTFHRLRNFS